MAVFVSNGARTDAKLCQNAFQTIPNVSFFDAKKICLTNFSDRKICFLPIWCGFRGSTAERTSKSASASNFALDRLILSCLRQRPAPGPGGKYCGHESGGQNLWSAEAPTPMPGGLKIEAWRLQNRSPEASKSRPGGSRIDPAAPQDAILEDFELKKVTKGSPSSRKMRFGASLAPSLRPKSLQNRRQNLKKSMLDNKPF